MPRFRIRIVTGQTRETRRALEGAGMRATGKGDELTAMVEADSADAAKARVRKAVGSTPRVGRAERA